MLGISRNSPVFEFAVSKHGIRATAIALENGHMVVRKGSTARDDWRGIPEHGYAARHAELRGRGVLKRVGDKSIFTQDHEFTSPSAASAVVAGRSANGPTDWTLIGSNKTYGEWKKSIAPGADEN